MGLLQELFRKTDRKAVVPPERITLQCGWPNPPIEGKITFDPSDPESVEDARRIAEAIRFPPPCRTQCNQTCPFEVFDENTQRLLKTFGKSPLVG